MITLVRVLAGAIFGAVIGVGTWATSGFGGDAKVGIVLVGTFSILSAISAALFGDRFWSADDDKSWWRFL